MPLVRWTIGKVSPLGWEILEHSVRSFTKLYPEFDRVICYNHLNEKEIKDLEKFNVKLHEQKATDLDYSLLGPIENPPAAGEMASGWKLVPPRLKQDTHELWLDNDIIIIKRMPSIEKWLNSDKCIISNGLYGVYGRFKALVSSKKHVNAGFFGLPPGFDFKIRILEYCKHLNGEPLGHFDEQGLVCSILTEFEHIFVLPKELTILEPNSKLPEDLPNALHFVVANRSRTHAGYKWFLSKLI